jgi:hypothetical protein
MPVTSPPLTVAMPVLLLLHTPPPTPSLSKIVLPIHTAVVPPMAVGARFTVIVLLTVQLPPREYVISDVPADMPVTIPVEKPIVATPVLLLVQPPPPTPSLRVISDPAHTVAGPLMAVGDGLTDTVVVTRQPVGNI